jgi:hypothetical protein
MIESRIKSAALDFSRKSGIKPAVLGCCSNTDKEIWRKKPGDYYAPSIHVTEGGGIGMNVGGHVIVAPIERWHEAAELLMCVNPCLPEWRRKLAMWLLNARVKGYKQPNVPDEPPATGDSRTPKDL